jgi:outer membrane receptor protein involved in Fe transport
MGDRRGTGTFPLVESYTRVDASLRYRAKILKRSTSLVLSLNNLTNQTYLISQTNLGDSRSVRLTLRTDF